MTLADVRDAMGVGPARRSVGPHGLASSGADGLRVHELELDLDVFAGPFDLLLSLVLREELDLLEVDLADVVITYIDHLERASELDLEAATEFLVLIAALLELKSRLMLPGEELPELDELAPAEAAEELLARMLQYARYRGARLAGRAPRRTSRATCYRAAPLPPACAAPRWRTRRPSTSRRVLGAALGGLLRTPPPIDLSHMATPRVALADRLACCAGCCAAARSPSTRPSAAPTGMTVAVTLFALLELYKRGEAGWEQDEPFGDITVMSAAAERAAHEAGVVTGLARAIEALLFLAPDPVPVDELADALQAEEDDVARGAGRAAPRAATATASCCASSAGGWALASHPDAEEAARRLLARPRTPPLTPAQAETLSIVAYLQPVSRPEVARIRGVASESATAALIERGLIEESGRSQFGAVLYRTTPLFLKLFGLKSVDDLPDPAAWDPSPEDEAALRERLLRAGEERSQRTGALGAPHGHDPEAGRPSRPRSSSAAPTTMKPRLGSRPRRATFSNDGRVRRAEDPVGHEVLRLPVVDAGRVDPDRLHPSRVDEPAGGVGVEPREVQLRHRGLAALRGAEIALRVRPEAVVAGPQQHDRRFGIRPLSRSQARRSARETR